jgi:sec-independent protein translocase protein TatB
MFDLSWGELVLIGMVALIVIGPKELPTVLRTMGQWMTRIRRMASEFQGQFQEAMREAEFADLKKQVDSISDPAQHLKDYDPLASVQRELDSAFDDKPKTSGADGDAKPEKSAASDPYALPTDPSLTSADAPPAPPAEAVHVEPPATPDGDKPPAMPDIGGGRAA